MSSSRKVDREEYIDDLRSEYMDDLRSASDAETGSSSSARLLASDSIDIRRVLRSISVMVDC